MEGSPEVLATPQSAGRAHSQVHAARSALSAALAALQRCDSDDDDVTDARAQSALLQAAEELRVAAVSAATLDLNTLNSEEAWRNVRGGRDDSAVNAALTELAQCARDARLECARLRAELQWERSRSQQAVLGAPADGLAHERVKAAKLWAALQAAYVETETIRAERDALIAASTPGAGTRTSAG